jgi:hypothetical protein
VQLRVKLAAIASATALLAGLAFAFAGPAAASDGIRLCLSFGSTGSSVYCVQQATGEGGQPILGNGVGSGAAWDAPNTGQGQISYDGTPKYCMEIITSRSDIISEEPCQGKSIEEWQVIGSTTVFGGKTAVAYVYESVYNSKLCLAGSSSYAGALHAITCNFKAQTQAWMQCSGACSTSS